MMSKNVFLLTVVVGVAIGLSLVRLAADPASESGKWINVTPSGVDLDNPLSCDNYGTTTMVVDPARPSNLYTQFHCQGVWKSTDYGATWSGPINTGKGGAGASGAGGLTIARGPDGEPPILYSAGIRGTGLGFWKSKDGGVSWTNSLVAPGRERQDFYPPDVNPWDPNHLIMCGHEMNLIVQSRDGGRTWSSVRMDDGMNQNGGTGFLFFVNTGNPETTAKTWLWTAQGTGGLIGTWRTSNGGESWQRVDSGEHPHGQMQIYQPDASGVVYMAGMYSKLGAGVLRSADYGQTWTHVGNAMDQATVFGTAKRVYAMYAWAVQKCDGCLVDPALQAARQPGISGWTRMTTPPDMKIGPAQAAAVFDGTNHFVLTANWRGGLWRFAE